MEQEDQQSKLSEAVNAVRSARGNKSEAARILGISRSALRDRLSNAARKGIFDGSFGENPPGMDTFSSCIHYTNGGIRQEWRRVIPERRSIIELAESLKKDIPAYKKPINLPKIKKSDLVGFICMGDLHVGKLSYEPEVGGSWDSKIAARVGAAAVAEVTDYVSQAGTVVLAINGDHWHADNRDGTTEKSGNILDMDSRYTRNLKLGIDCIRQAVDCILKKGSRVELILTPGNHDYHTACAASLIMDAYYRGCQRVRVDTTDSPRKAVRAGKNLIALAHGDRIKPNDWSKILPVDPVTSGDWSDCPYRYLFLGHIHQRRKIEPIRIDEQAGLHVEYLPALCEADAWHYESGYIGAGRAIDAILFHREFGLQARITRDIRQVMRRAGYGEMHSADRRCARRI